MGPLKVMLGRQHCPVGATQLKGPPHCCIDMTVRPVAPATPTNPSPPRAGRSAEPAMPERAPAATPPPMMELGLTPMQLLGHIPSLPCNMTRYRLLCDV